MHPILRKTVFIWLFSALSFALSAQTEAQGDALFRAANYEEAADVYGRLLSRQPSNPLYLYRYARCAQETGRTAEAITYFERAGERYPLRNYYLGELYLRVYRFREAEQAFVRYQQTIRPDHERYAATEQGIERAGYLQRQLQRTEDVRFLDRTLLAATAWPETVSRQLTAGQIDSIGYTNARGDLRLYSDSGQLFQVVRLLDAWSEPEALPFRGEHPFLLPDGVTLYFAAPGEIGGLDLYVTRRNTESNTWLNPTLVSMPYSSLANDLFYGIDESHGLGYLVSERGDSVELLRFAYSEEKQYLKDSTEAQQCRMARRELLRPFSAEEQAEQPAAEADTTADEAEEDAFQLVISDEVIYTELDDFRSDSARVLYLQYQQIEADIEAEQEELSRQRAAWQQADEAQRDTTAGVILSLEKDLLRLGREARVLLQAVRREEQQTITK